MACALILVLLLTNVIPRSKSEIKHSESVQKVRVLNRKLFIFPSIKWMDTCVLFLVL